MLTKSEEQPHALGYAAGETLRGENAERVAVPGTKGKSLVAECIERSRDEA